jgi:oligopeptide/dipeptide ABC transporter ATP-binding protein
VRLLEVRQLRIRAGAREIVTGIDLELDPGEALGIVGESGSGKSLTGRAVSGVLPRGVEAAGAIVYQGRDLLQRDRRAMRAIRGREIAMIFQDPFTMLNPLMRCGAQIVELIRDDRGQRLDRRARRRVAQARLEEVGIEDPAVVDAYPFELSGGMRQRVGIAAALALDPKLLIADEPSTALDVLTQRGVLARLRELQTSRGMTLILVTHDLRVAFSMCDRVNVLYAGSMLESAAAPDLEREPRHPYTLGLLVAEPPADRRVAQLRAIPGSVPDPGSVEGSCPFAPRCAWAQAQCLEGAPPLLDVGGGRQSACRRQGEIRAEMGALALAAAVGEVATVASASGSALVAVTELSKTFVSSRADRRVTALDRVSIEIAAGERVGVVGRSGSGKTTLGRCLVGLEDPTGGRIVIDGIDASARRALSRAQRRTLRRTVQMVFQDPYSTLNPARTVGSTLEEAIAAGDSPAGNTRGLMVELLERVGLPARHASLKPAALSGGERQRVAIARALATNPRLLVCDEAVSALDVSVQAQILNLLLSLHRETGVSLLFITHDLAVVRHVADRLYVMREGGIVEEGLTETVLDSPQHPYTKALLAAVPRSDRAWLSAAPAAVG